MYDSVSRCVLVCTTMCPGVYLYVRQCVLVCMTVCTGVHLYVQQCVHVYLYVRQYVRVCTCMNDSEYRCVLVCATGCTCVHLYVQQYVQVCTCMCRFQSRRCFTLCITVEVEPRITKQYKCHHCCSCKNYRGKVMEGGKQSVFASVFV